MDRRSHDFDGPIFTRQFFCQKFIQMYQMFRKLWYSVLVKNLKGLKTVPTFFTERRIFHILASEDSDDVISRFFTVVCANSQLKNGEG